MYTEAGIGGRLRDATFPVFSFANFKTASTYITFVCLVFNFFKHEIQYIY
ncbi:MAG: hypothetical protein LBH59_10575 [Planctomycetaceae bacterium]|nr:hypothetical protein [Planctomycetaceae bacterium]